MRAEEAGGPTSRCERQAGGAQRHCDPGGRLDRRAGHRRAILRRRRKLKSRYLSGQGTGGGGGGQETGWQAARKGKRKLAGTLEARHRGLPP